MKRQVWIGGFAALALVCGVGVGAQSNPSQTSTANTTTVTGCLKPADQVSGAVGTSGTTPSSSTSANKMENFVLTTKRSTTSTGSSSSSVGTSGSMTSGSTYILEGDSTELKAHTNQEVEITGKIEPSTSSSSSATPGTASSSSSTAERIQVQSVRMIAESCSSK